MPRNENPTHITLACQDAWLLADSMLLMKSDRQTRASCQRLLAVWRRTFHSPVLDW
jgi:hypothetical protein